ncbi:MAG: hypothetical protein J6S83_11590 [Lachnospiraceae bacterium]|nr:hypothetical protein [Lachnospiraceae bacterium]
MDKLEKIERLRERANVSYEEAREALEQADGDLLDAIVLLEKQGKVRKPEQSTYTTQYEEQQQYIRVVDKVEEQKQSAPSLGKSIGKLVHAIISFVMHSTFHVTRREKTIFTVPSVILAILVVIFWKAAVPVAIVALLLGFRFSFEGDGAHGTDTANDLLNKAGNIADDIQNGLRKEENS